MGVNKVFSSLPISSTAYIKCSIVILQHCVKADKRRASNGVLRKVYCMNSTGFDGWPAAVCSFVTLLNITPLSFFLSLSNDMGAGIPEPPVGSHSCISLLVGFCGPTNLTISLARPTAKTSACSMLGKPAESTHRQFNPPQRLTLCNRATREQERRSPLADRGWSMAGKSTTRKPPFPPPALISTFFNACISLFDTFQTNLF